MELRHSIQLIKILKKSPSVMSVHIGNNCIPTI